MLKEHNGYSVRFENDKVNFGSAMFVPDYCVMANVPIPMLVVEKPDSEDVVDKSTNDKLVECMARLQGKLSRVFILSVS